MTEINIDAQLEIISLKLKVQAALKYHYSICESDLELENLQNAINLLSKKYSTSSDFVKINYVKNTIDGHTTKFYVVIGSINSIYDKSFLEDFLKVIKV